MKREAAVCRVSQVGPVSVLALRNDAPNQPELRIENERADVLGDGYAGQQDTREMVWMFVFLRRKACPFPRSRPSAVRGDDHPCEDSLFAAVARRKHRRTWARLDVGDADTATNLSASTLCFRQQDLLHFRMEERYRRQSLRRRLHEVARTEAHIHKGNLHGARSLQRRVDAQVLRFRHTPRTMYSPRTRSLNCA